VIDSPQNSHVAAARALLTRKGRTAASAFLVEGPHGVGEALAASGQRVSELFVTKDAAGREPALMRDAAAAGVAVRLVTERVLASLRDTVTPQGVIAVVDAPKPALAEVLGDAPRLVVLLEGIADPGNAGAVIRTADAAGADAVVTTSGSVDLTSGKTVRASAGSVFHLPLVAEVVGVQAVELARVRGCQILATGAEGDTDLDVLIDGGELGASTMWVFGNEAHGVSTQIRERADRVVRLPIYGRAESLNLAAAAAVCLYASARAQRR
jgi:TrmH family RNA methyltransferase